MNFFLDIGWLFVLVLLLMVFVWCKDTSRAETTPPPGTYLLGKFKPFNALGRYYTDLNYGAPEDAALTCTLQMANEVYQHRGKPVTICMRENGTLDIQVGVKENGTV